MMSSEYGNRMTVSPMALTWLSKAFQFADQMPWGMRLLVSNPNQLTPVIRTTLPAASTIFEPEVDQYPSPAAAAVCDPATRMPMDSRIARSAHCGYRFMAVLQDRNRWIRKDGRGLESSAWCSGLQAPAIAPIRDAMRESLHDSRGPRNWPDRRLDDEHEWSLRSRRET